jgi:hypothetical protein
MERRLESIKISYWQKYLDDGGEIRNVLQVVVTYRNIIDGIPQHVDTIVIGKDTDYSECEEKVKKICQIAFEEQ